MSTEYKEYRCKYKAEWPVDKFGRLGGMYSMADLPVNAYVELEREGLLVSQDSKKELYEIKDAEKQFIKRVVPFSDVTDIEEIS